MRGEQTTSDLGNGEFVTNLTPPIEPTLTSAPAVDNVTIPCCFKAKLIVYYDKSFAEKFTAAGPPAVNPVTKYDLFFLNQAMRLTFNKRINILRKVFRHLKNER